MRKIKEIRIQFNDGSSHYTVYIVKKLFQRQSVHVWKEKRKLNNFKTALDSGERIKPEVSASTLGENIDYWLIILNRYLIKKRRQKHCKA